MDKVTARVPRPVVSLSLDLLAVLVFATIGRASHEEGLTLPGVLGTALPFALGAVMGAAVARVWAIPCGTLLGGLVVWPTTVVIGMVVRQVSDQGTAASFVVVATLFLGATMLGWRLLASRLGARRLAGGATA